MQRRVKFLCGWAVWAVALVAAAACSSGRGSAEAAVGVPVFTVEPAGVAPLPAEAQQKYNTFYLEAVRQGLNGNEAACRELLSRALDFNPDGAEAISRFVPYVSDTAEVVRLLKHAIAVAPENPTYRSQLVYCYLQQSELDSAISVLRTVIDREEYPIDDLWLLYRLENQQQYYDDALRTLSRLERLEGSSEGFDQERIRLYTSAKQVERAYDEVKRLCADNPNELRYPMLLASLYLDNGRADEGYALCRQVQAKDPGNSMVQAWLIAYYKDRNDTAACLAEMDSFICNPKVENAARYQLLGGLVYEQREDTTEQAVRVTLDLFRKALNQPQENSAIAELCEQYMTYTRQPADSITKVLWKNLEITPDNSAARTRLLFRLIESERDTAIVRLCREGELYNPTHLHYYLYESIALSQQDRRKEAIAAVRRGLEHRDDEGQREMASDLYAILGDLLHEDGRKDEAYAAYDSCLVYNDENINCLNNYAYFLSLDGVRLDEAEQMSYKTLQTDSVSPTYLDTYAWILFEQGRYEQARLYIDETMKYVDETEENASIYDHAGDIYMKCGRMEEAVDFWRRALRLTTESVERKKIERKIKKYSHL